MVNRDILWIKNYTKTPFDAFTILVYLLVPLRSECEKAEAKYCEELECKCRLDVQN